jgi:hypothetical protein
MVKPLAPFTLKMSPGSAIEAGALIVAARDWVELSVMSFLVFGMVSCSA